MLLGGWGTGNRCAGGREGQLMENGRNTGVAVGQLGDKKKKINKLFRIKKYNVTADKQCQQGFL